MAQKYFEDLNYSLANEDSGLEAIISKNRKSKRILSICGSGSRCFPLISENTTDLYLLDFSQQQLWLAELRADTFRKLDFDEFLKFWGYAPFSADQNNTFRKDIFSQLNISDLASSYLMDYFEKNQWNSLLYQGKWEKTFISFSKLIRKILSRHADKIFEFSNIQEQRNYFDNQFPWWRWNFIVSIIGNKALFNLLLYKGDFVVKNVTESYFSYYSKAFKQLFYHDFCKNSFFLQLIFLGEVKLKEGNLAEAKENQFLQIKNSLQHTNIHYLQGDFLTASEKLKNIDFISMSNVPSYLSGEVENTFLEKLSSRLSPKGCIVSRYYLRVPESNRNQYLNINSQYEKSINDEKVQMYKIEILEKK